MAGAKKGTWIGGTVFVCLVVMAIAWFVAVSPTMSQAASVRDQTQQVTASNDVLQQKITKLAKDFANLPKYQQDLADVRTQVPTTAQLSDYLRQLDQLAQARSVAVTAVTPSAAQAFVAAAASAPTPSPSPSDTGAATDTGATTDPTAAGGGTATAPKAAASSVPAGLAAIPLSITVLGTYDNTLAFLNDLQTATKRLFLVSGFTGTALQDGPAGGGKPATHVGDQELTVTGYLYVLPDDAATAPSPSPSATATAPALPAPVQGKDPLVPVAGK